MPDRHARLSPSSSERWFHCPPSVQASEQFVDHGSPYATQGTEAHTLCEYELKKALGDAGLFADAALLVDPRPGLQQLDQQMEDAAAGYVSFVMEKVSAYLASGIRPVVLVEQLLDLTRFIPEGMGTSDCVIVGGDQVTVVDFKYGYHQVPASSMQLRIYALGACALLENIYEISRVRTAIFQPRLDTADEYDYSREELYRWAEEELKPHAEMAWKGEGEYQVGDWCRFCLAKPACRAQALHQLSLARFDFQDPGLLSGEEVAEVLSKADTLINWVNSVKDYAMKRALSGEKIPGWKLVEGRSNRCYRDEAKAAEKLLAAGYNPYESRLISVGAMEKMLGRKNFDRILANLVERPCGKPTLVPVTDHRPEWKAIINDFK